MSKTLLMIVESQEMENVTIWYTWVADYSKDIRSHIDIANSAFSKKRSFKNSDLLGR